MSPLAHPRSTPEEYLVRERRAQYRSEYVDGRVYATAGASRAHNLVAGNVFAELRAQMRGRPCEAYVSDMRVKVSRTGLYTYPDVVAVRGEPSFEDAHVDTLLNPAVIVEVLSESTEGYDRGEKFSHYRRLESLREYVLVAQDRIRVEHFARQGDHWMLTEISDPDASLELPSVGCTVALRGIYERVELPAGGDLPLRAGPEAK
ncbi:MAG: Uma2 family endonuclease [Gemmatimonadota bacterium]